MSTYAEAAMELMEISKKCMSSYTKDAGIQAPLFAIASGLFALASAVESNGISPYLEGLVAQIATELGRR